MKKAKKILALFLVCLMVVSIVACGGTTSSAPTSSNAPNNSTPKSSSAPSTTASAPKKDTLEIQIDNDAGSLNPSAIGGTGIYFAIPCLYESMWEVDEQGNVIYLLAESVEQKSPTQWICHLRKGVKFSNGNPLTADDVIFSIGVFKKAASMQTVRVQSLDVPNCKAIDDYTVDLRMTDFYVYNWSACSQLVIYDKESYDADALNRKPIGTGPYKLKEYVPNSYCYLDRRDDYWGKKPDIAHLNFRVVAEPSQISNSLDTGKLDVANIALQDYDHISKLPGYQINERATGGGILLTFNSGKNSFFTRFFEPERTLQARKAIIAAVDPTAIINLVYYGHAEKMNYIAPKFCLDYDPEYDNMDETYKIGFNLDRAKQLAQSSGLDGKTITVATNGLAATVQMAEILQGMLAKINVTVKIANYDPATLMTMMSDPEGKHDLTIGAGISPNRRVCDILVQGVKNSKILSTPGAFPDNENYLKIAPKTITTPDDKERQAITKKVLGLFMENCIQFALCQQKTCLAINKGIDMKSVRFAISNGAIRWMDLKWA